MGLLTCSLGIPWVAQAGSAPGGASSGLTTTGSGPLSIGGSPITSESTTSTSPNVMLDPQTGTLLLTSAAQQTVNQTALQLVQQLEATNPGLIAALSNSFVIDPDRQFEEITLAIRGINDGEPVPKRSLQAAALDAQVAIADQLRWVILRADQNVLELTAPLVVLTAPDQFSMVALFNPGNEMAAARLPLQGTLENLGDATAFLIVTAGSGLSPDAVAPFVAMALEGAPYEELITLLNAVNALVVATAAGEDIDPNQLNLALHAYGAIIETVDQATLNQLASNPEFRALGQALQALRQAVET